MKATETRSAPERNHFETTHKLDFMACEDPKSRLGFHLFRIGTCHGQWRAEFDAYEILSIINDTPGNGHFEDVLQWFEFACRRDKKSLRFMAMLNDRFTQHLIEKRGFKPVVLEKEFEPSPLRALCASVANPPEAAP